MNIYITIIWLTLTNLYTLHILYRVILLHKSKDLWEYSRIIEKRKKKEVKIPTIIETPIDY